MNNNENIMHTTPGELIKTNRAKISLGYVMALSKALKINPILESDGEMLPLETIISRKSENYMILFNGKNAETFGKLVDEKLKSAAKSIYSFNSEMTYKDILNEVCDHLEIKKSDYNKSGITFPEQEILICRGLLEKMLEKAKKSNKEEEFNKKLEKIIKEEDKDYKQNVGNKSPSEYLLAISGSTVGAFLITNIVTAFMISGLGITNTILLSVGLYVLPFWSVFLPVFASIAGLFLVGMYGRHNYKKTIPTIVLISSLRQNLAQKRLK